MENSQRKLKVFLCHSSTDKAVVSSYYDTLSRDGIEAWLDKKCLIPGQNWQIEIPKVVKSSDIVIVFLSEESVTKEGYVQKEIKIALDVADEKLDETIYIIPARLNDCKVPERLAKYHWVDLFQSNEYDKSDGYQHLLKALKTRADGLGITITEEPPTESVSIGYEKIRNCPIHISKGMEDIRRRLEIMGFSKFKEYDYLPTSLNGVAIISISNSENEHSFNEFIKHNKPNPLKIAFIIYTQGYYRLSSQTLNSYENLQIANTTTTTATVTWIAAQSISR